jgi:hypothetical protein
MPSFFHGSYREVHRKSREEGLRYGEHYRRTGSFPLPRELFGVSSGERVIAHEVVDFQRERPAWRLYMLASVADGVCEALDWQNSRLVGDAFEEYCRGEAWGALYFAISHDAPMSNVRMALRLRAVLRSWVTLQSARYLFKDPQRPSGLEELMMAACDWALEAWSSEVELPVRARLERVAERMERATREESTEVILRQMSRILAHAHGVKHPTVLADPRFLRERLSALDSAAFAPVSAAWPAMLIRQLHLWDRQLDPQ